MAAVVERKIGKGKIILLGTVPQKELLLRLAEVDTSGQAVKIISSRIISYQITFLLYRVSPEMVWKLACCWRNLPVRRDSCI